MSAYHDRVNEIVASAKRRAGDVGIGEIVWLNEDETKALNEAHDARKSAIAELRRPLANDEGYKAMYERLSRALIVLLERA